MGDYRFRIIQDGIVVAGGSASERAYMLREMVHYATLYAQEGTIQIEERSGKGRWRRHLP